MADHTPHTPRQFQGVMVSSTFTDLAQHRDALMAALRKEKLFAIGMEDYVPTPGDDVISSSLGMVRESTAYICLISHRYGQVVECPKRNPEGYSVTRLEFEEAQRLGLPTLVCVMGDEHPGTRADFETDPEKLKKLDVFRERAKQGRIYIVFQNLEDLTKQVGHAAASLRRYLETPPAPPPAPVPPVVPSPTDPIPAPPAFYAEPPYIGSHQFLGRRAQLDTLDDWARPADSHPVLLFEAIGGTGKSILTWHWANHHAPEVRGDWAGRFWYSFYEKGAVMADFCQRALAYMTGQPLADFRKQKTAALTGQLLHQLQARPWLLVLDGLERVLVSYHRYDAAQLADEEAGSRDVIGHRDPCAAIRPEDDELLRQLAAAAPSKLLITTRLTPKVLLNAANQAIPGVLRERLPGLRPADAEALLRACGVRGDSAAMQAYLQEHCDCHPLVTGVLAGLILDYLPDRGNFDAWAKDAAGGGKLNLADLDLVQKRNHILLFALDALAKESRQLLSTLALLSEAVDYEALSAFNPHTPPTSKALAHTVTGLEKRGLLQWDGQTKRHDLHPVVRGVAAGRLSQAETQRLGQQVVDHFSSQSHSPYEQAESLEDLRGGLHVVRTLLRMGRYQEACAAYRWDLAQALVINLEDHAETLSLLRPFFPHGWANLPEGLEESDASSLANAAAIALAYSGDKEASLAIFGSTLLSELHRANWQNLSVGLRNISITLAQSSRLAGEERCLKLALLLAESTEDKEEIFLSRMTRFGQLTRIGQWVEAEAIWQLLDPMGRAWSRAIYRPGDAEYWYAQFHYWRGDLWEEHLVQAEQLAQAGKNRPVIRNLHNLRGAWRIDQGAWALAAESLSEAVRMAREVGLTDAEAETGLALAKFHLGQLPDPRHEAESVAKLKGPNHRRLAELWRAIGDHEQAIHHALQAYRWAWAGGEPYVRRYELEKSRELLEKLGEPIPDLPPYDPAQDPKLPWEDAVAAAIEKLRAEQAGG